MHLLRSLAVAFTFSAALAACGGGSKPAPAEPAPEAAPQNEAPPETPPVAEDPAEDAERPTTIETIATGLPACDEYFVLMQRYLACDKIPQETRDASRQGIEAMKQSWGDIANLPPDVKQQTNDACMAANDALRQGATALGCTL